MFFVPSSESRSPKDGEGDTGRVEGADLVACCDGKESCDWGAMRRGSGVEHISHERIEGWFKNVHAGHANVLGCRVWI